MNVCVCKFQTVLPPKRGIRRVVCVAKDNVRTTVADSTEMSSPLLQLSTVFSVFSSNFFGCRSIDLGGVVIQEDTEGTSDSSSGSQQIVRVRDGSGSMSVVGGPHVNDCRSTMQALLRAVFSRVVRSNSLHLAISLTVSCERPDGRGMRKRRGTRENMPS
eukprot:m.332602 g.332602  ORF g.332602 m.332602 type:complete len:160 (+) comp20493_c0_seq47:1150-1629(+)